MTDQKSTFTLAELILMVRDWKKILKIKIRVIILIVFFGCSLGLIYALINKPVYKAVLTFALDEDKGTGGGGAITSALGIASQFGIDIGGASAGGAFAATNLTELMKSRFIIEKVLLNKIDSNSNSTLIDFFLSTKELKSDLEDYSEFDQLKFNSNRQSFSKKQDSVLNIVYKQIVKKNLNISQKDRKVTILSLEVSTKNEFFSKKFCEEVAKELSKFYVESKSKKARINVDILQKQTDSIRSELNLAISGAASQSDEVFNLNPSLNTRGVPSRKKMVDVQANTKILEQLVIQLELAKVTLRKETPLIQVIDRPILPLEVEKVGKIKSIILFGFLAFVIAILFVTLEDLFKKNKV